MFPQVRLVITSAASPERSRMFNCEALVLELEACDPLISVFTTGIGEEQEEEEE